MRLCVLTGEVTSIGKSVYRRESGVSATKFRFPKSPKAPQFSKTIAGAKASTYSASYGRTEVVP